MEKLDIKCAIISKQKQTSENYKTFLNLARKNKVSIQIVEKGNTIKIGNDIYIDILWPKQEHISQNALNNNSIVAKLNYRNVSMLLTGDIEEIAEKQILAEYKNSDILKSTILKVGHHGSKTSSTQEFLKAVNPKIALIGVGKDNNFGHPNDNVIERLERLRHKNI